jgi:hypothetical protein
MDAQWGLLWVTAVTAHTSHCGLKDFFCMTCLESWRWWASKATWFRVDPFFYLPIPSYTILYHPRILCLSLPIYPHISIQFHASIHLSRYTVTCISLYLKNVFRGTERKQRTTQKHIENHHWELLQTRVMALLPSLLHFSLETPPEAPHDAAAALSLFICKVWRLSGWCIDTKGSGSTAEKGEAGNAGPVALRSWCWRFSMH